MGFIYNYVGNFFCNPPFFKQFIALFYGKSITKMYNNRYVNKRRNGVGMLNADLTDKNNKTQKENYELLYFAKPSYFNKYVCNLVESHVLMI